MPDIFLPIHVPVVPAEEEISVDSGSNNKVNLVDSPTEVVKLKRQAKIKKVLVIFSSQLHTVCLIYRCIFSGLKVYLTKSYSKNSRFKKISK